MKCPVCGKRFPVLYQTIWTYKRGGNYLCSYDCMRRYDRGEIGMEQKITKEMREEAVRIALKGGNYLKYLRECGSGNPSAHWALIKKALMKKDPETYEKLAKLPDKRKKPEIPEAPVKAEVPEKLEKVNIEQIKRVYPPAEELFPEFEHRITGIETQIGDFQYFRRNGYLDWTPLDGNGTVSLTVEEWKGLLKLMPLIAKRLGVEL